MVPRWPEALRGSEKHFGVITYGESVLRTIRWFAELLGVLKGVRRTLVENLRVRFADPCVFGSQNLRVRFAEPWLRWQMLVFCSVFNHFLSFSVLGSQNLRLRFCVFVSVTPVTRILSLFRTPSRTPKSSKNQRVVLRTLSPYAITPKCLRQ